MQAIFMNKKDAFSSWLLIIFSATLIATAAYTKYFHLPGAQDHNLERIRILFNANDLGNVKKLELKNRLGVFKTEKFNSEKMGEHWLLTSPRRLFANTKTITNILDILKDIRIKKVYQKDPINIANFSLNTPNLELKLFDNTGGELKITIGLINPIDNSTYLLSSDSDAIFHIQALPSLIEKISFSDFIDSNISNLSFDNLKSFKIYKKGARKAQLELLSNKEKMWETKEGRLLDAQSVKSFYTKFVSTQSYMILDVTNKDQKAAIEELMKEPLYKIKVAGENNKSVTFSVSTLIHTIPDVKIEKRKYVVIQSSNKDYPYIYNKDILKNFYKTQYSFKRRSR